MLSPNPFELPAIPSHPGTPMPPICTLGAISQQKPPIVGIVLAHAFDEWLKELGISLQSFADRMMGSWVFNYVQALQAVGVSAVLFCVSSQVRTRTELVHAPTACKIIVLPPPILYRMLRRWYPKQRSAVRTGKSDSLRSRLALVMREAVELVLAGYLATPLLALFREIGREDCRSLLVQEYESVRFDLCSCMGYLENLPVFAAFTGGKSTRLPGRPLKRLALSLCSGLLIPSRRESERVRQEYRLPAEKITCSFPPVDSSTFHPTPKTEARAVMGIPQTAKVAIYHGAISLHYKGLDILLQAWERICNRHPSRDLRLILVGTGDDAAKLSRQITEKQLRGIEWINEWVQDRRLIQRYLCAADVYVFPSRGDACPNAVIEAMACGLPVLATDVNGIPDILDGAGCVVPAGDGFSFAEALERLFSDDHLARALGQSAVLRINEAFTMQGIGQPLKQFLLRQEA